jgi:hypothetical protein
MTKLVFIANSTAAVTETTFDGRPYLVAPVVMIREGVLNGLLYLSEEFSRYAASWNGRPVTLGHPTRGGEYVSANSQEVWASEVPGQVWNTTVDDKSLKAEIWIDLEKAARIGKAALDIADRLRKGQPIEVSTGLFADEEEKAGVWMNGASYSGIARDIKPDHLALLPDEIGACSWDDGCGVPRINKEKEPMEVNEMTLDDRASVVRRAFWDQVQASSVGDPYDGDFDVISVFDDVIITKDWMTKAHTAFPYTLDAEGVVAFSVPTPVEVVYRAQGDGAEVVVSNEQEKQTPKPSKPASLLARAARLLRGNSKTEQAQEEDKTDSLGVNTQQEQESMKKCEAVAALTANKSNKLSREQLEAMSEDVLSALVESFKANEEAAQVEAPAAQEVAAQAATPAVPEWQKAFEALNGKIDSVLGAINANADREKTDLVKGLLANAQCPFDEKELGGMSLPTLQKVASSYLPRNYSGAAGAFYSNASEEDRLEPMPMPTPKEWQVADKGSK